MSHNRYRESSRTAIWSACLLVLLTFLAYLPAFRAGFIWDDNLLVTANPLVRNFSAFPAIWTGRTAVDYTPVTLSAFWLEWRLWGGNAMGYHLVNICLFASSIILLWRILGRLSIPGAWLGALFFAIHPINVASVAWVAEQKNTISLLFYLLAIFWFLDFRQYHRGNDYLLALAAAALAMLSKGSTVILPAVLMLCTWWRDRKLRRADLIEITPFLCVAAAISMVTIRFQSRLLTAGYEHVSLPFRIARAGDAVWFYLWKDVWPVDLCAIYPMWPIHPEASVSYLPFIAFAGCLLFLGFGARYFGRGPFAALTYFMITLLPVLGLVEMGYLDQAYVADWWQQLALIAVTTMAGAGAAIVWSHRGLERKLATAVALVIIGFLIGRTWYEAEGYYSLEIHCRRTLALNPKAWNAWNNLGVALKEKGRLGEAVIAYQKGLQYRPDDRGLLYNLANTMQAQGRLDEAAQNYRKALATDPGFSAAMVNLGIVLLDQGDTVDAETEFHRALEIDPDDPEACSNLGNILMGEGRIAEAVTEYRNVLRAQPDSAAAHSNLGAALAANGAPDEAIQEYLDAQRLSPGDARIYNNLGNALRRQGKLDDAIVQFREAVRLDPSNARIRANLEAALNASADGGK